MKIQHGGGGLGQFDAATLAAAMAQPEKQHISYGVVDPDNERARSVVFDERLGPLVNVTLQPSGTPVRCRIAMANAGNGEAEYHPFVAGDEVLVAIPQGDERAGCAIIGRFNQELDTFPRAVAGQPTINNSVAFKATRSPYIHELGSGYLVHQATTNAFISIDPAGNFTASSGDKSFVHVGYDFVGFQNADATLLLQGAQHGGDPANAGWLIQAATQGGSTSVMKVGLKGVYISTSEQLSLAGSGEGGPVGGLWHAVSVESVLAMISALFTAIGIAQPGPLTGSTLAAAVATLGASGAFLNPASILAGYNAMKAGLAIGLAAQTKINGTAPGVASATLIG